MMLHLGDITKIRGSDVPPVDVVIGGSPCQDLSIAGKRAGLAGARSGLYMEQIRVIKEMRANDMASGRTGEFVRPRYMVWENVPGAFSSNGGRDFAAVIEEAIRIAEPEAPDIEVPEKGWNTWGGYHDEVGGRWSVAWRVLDAQHWGVPQRRRRIALIADFGGDTAGEISFERKSVSGDITESRAAGEGPSGDAENGASYAVRIRSGCDGGGKGALVQEEKSVALYQPKSAMDENWAKSSVKNALRANESRASHCVVCLNDQGGSMMGVSHNVSGTLRAQEHGHQPSILDMSHACDVIRDCGKISPSLQARMGTGGNQIPLTYQKTTGTLSPGAHAGSYNGQDAYNDMLVCGVKCPDVAHTLRGKAGCAFREDAETYPVQNMVVRRLTPLECERLQGFPSKWTDIGDWTDSKGKRHKSSDSPRYKAFGNSIALPPWKWLLKRICAQYTRNATMASLFDGIGGFPLIWEQLNGQGSCLWASEIEEFPMAVTRKRFGDAATGELGDMGKFLFPQMEVGRWND